MKKAIITVAVLMFAAEATAIVDIRCDQLDGEIVVSFTSSEPSNIVAFALDITVEGEANIVDVNCVNADYFIHPGSIQIDENGNVTDYGSCVCSAGYPGTLGGLDTNGVTIEMASLYIGEANAPSQSGELVRFTLECYSHVQINIAANTTRGGVVMNDPNEAVTVNFAGCSAGVEHWCWNTCVCAGQPLGDSTCDGSIDFLDLGALKVSFFKSAYQPGYNCCADFNQDQQVNFLDLGILKVNFFTSGYSPSTGDQYCPF
jgi:hypothetical protein